MALWNRIFGPNLVKRLRDALLFRPNDPLHLHQVPPANYKPAEVERIKGFRQPAPGSRMEARATHHLSTDDIYDIKLYPRDPRNFKNDNYLRYNTKGVSGLIEPNNFRGGSKGNKNPAVMAYDPTGLRSTMTASWESMEKALASVEPNHLPTPEWEHAQDEILQACEAKGIPVVPGRRFKFKVPKSYNDASW